MKQKLCQTVELPIFLSTTFPAALPLTTSVCIVRSTEHYFRNWRNV